MIDNEKDGRSTVIEGLLMPAAAAKILSISVDQLRDLTNEGLLRWINIGLGQKRPTRRYTKADLDEFIRERSVKSRTIHRQMTNAPAPAKYEGRDIYSILERRRQETQKAPKTGKKPFAKRS